MLKLPHNCTCLTRQQSNAQTSPCQAMFQWIQKMQRNQRSNCQHLPSHWKKREFQKSIYFCFTNYAKVFLTVQKILKEMGITDHLTCLLRNLYAGQEATVRTGHRTTDQFQIGKGVHEGCMWSPCLFNLYAEYIMRNARLDKAQQASRLLEEISITSDMQMIPPLWQKAKKN